MTQVISSRYFLKYREYTIYYNIIYQAYGNIIKLEKTGRRSIINRKRQINIRYYFVSYSITKQDASVELCPTLDMIDYYFTKALHGSQFRCFHNIILGIHEYDIQTFNASRRNFLEEINLKLKEDKE